MYLYVHARAVANEHQRSLGAGRPQAPDCAKKWRQLRYPLTADFEHDIAGLHSRALGGPTAGESADHESLLDLRNVHARPRAHQSCAASLTDQVVDDGVKQVDRHEHVAVNGVLVDLLLHQQRSYADQPAVVAHQRGPAPFGVSRPGEQRFVEHILPVACELALVDDLRLERVRVAAVTDHDYVVFGLDQSGRSWQQRLDAETAERLHQAEAAGEVLCQRIALHHGAVVGGKPDGFGFGDQIADGKNEAVVAHG